MIGVGPRIVRRAASFLKEVSRKSLFIVLEHICPAKQNYWCFGTWHGEYAHTQDNPRAVFEEDKYNSSIKKILLRRRGQVHTTALLEGENVVCVDVESLRGAYYLALSKVILIGYGLGGLCSYSKFLTTKHNIVQLWHGVPLKRIGKLFAGETHWDTETVKYAATVCSSPKDREIMAAAFEPVPIEQVWQTGLPRNDLILKAESDLPADYRHHLYELRRRLAGRRFILYAPTWREGGVGVYPFTDDELEKLRAVLSKHNAALGIRAHANRRLVGDKNTADILFFVNDFPDANVLLREAEVLVTDYSSIYIDFLLTDRPILYFTYDIDSYVSERGFLYDLNDAMIDQWFTSPYELVRQLDATLRGEVSLTDRYRRVKALFHEHSDCSAKAVANKIVEISKAKH